MPSTADPVPATPASQTVTEAVSADSLVPATSQTPTSQTMDEIECAAASSADPIPATSTSQNLTETVSVNSIVHANSILLRVIC